MASLTEIQYWAQGLQVKHPWEKHTFFKKLEAPPTPDTTPYMNRTTFLRAQKSFIHAVDYWSKILASLLAKVPEVWQRQLVLENLCDENGLALVEFEDDPNHHYNQPKSHMETFYDYLLALGLSPEVSLQHVPIDSPAQRFIHHLKKAEEKSWIFLASTLAIIEYSYIEVSNRLAQILEQSTWLSHPQEHYSTHAELDRKHADDLFRLVEGQPSEIIQAGLIYGHKVFHRYYEELAWKYFQPKSLITPDKYPNHPQF